jgi:hypothetical protein
MPVRDWTRVDAGIFHDFHLGWISALGRSLNKGGLPSNYYGLAQRAVSRLHPGSLVPASNSAITEAELYSQKRNRLAIHDASGDPVVAMLDIISPGTKGSRHALRSFVGKAVEFLQAGIQLLILDLFPPGPHDPQGIHDAVWSEISDSDDNF